MAEQNPNNLLVNYMMAQNPANALAYQRQQAIAQQLADNANDQMAPNTMASPGGYVVNQNPMIMAGKALEKGLSGYLMGKNQAALGAALQQGQPNPSSVTNAAIASETPAGSLAPMQGPASAQQLGAAMQSAQQPDPTTVTGTPQGDMWLSQINPERYKFMAAVKEAQLARTELQKNVNDPSTQPYMNDKLLTKDASGRVVPVSSLLPQQSSQPPAQIALQGQPAVAQPTSPIPRTLSSVPTQAQATGSNALPNGQPDNAATVYGGTNQPPIDTNNPIAVKAAEENASKNAENLSEANKQYNVAFSNMPRAFERFQEIRDAAPLASSGIGVDEDGGGHAVEFAQSFEPKTAKANQVINTAAKQGILAELGPQLTGMRPNKFLESIASGASGLNLRDPADVKVNTVNMLQDQYVGNLKAAAAQRRAYGDTTAPTDAQIDQMAMQAYPSKTINGNKYYNVRGTWHQE